MAWGRDAAQPRFRNRTGPAVVADTMNAPPESSEPAPIPRAPRTAVLVTVLFALLLAACSSGGDDRADDPATTTTTSSRGEERSDDETDDSSTTTTAASTTTIRIEDPGPPVEPDGEPTEFERDYIAELASDMGDSLGLPDSVDTACLATAWVRPIGGDRLQASGLDPQTFLADGPEALDLDRETATRMHRGGVGCGLTAEVFVSNIVSTIGECPDATINDADFEGIMVTVFTGDYDEQILQRLTEIEMACRQD